MGVRARGSAVWRAREHAGTLALTTRATLVAFRAYFLGGGGGGRTFDLVIFTSDCYTHARPRPRPSPTLSRHTERKTDAQ